jgi:glycine/serine hydroxymethyltransferase
METVAGYIDEILSNPADAGKISQIKDKVNGLMKNRPLFNY